MSLGLLEYVLATDQSGDSDLLTQVKTRVSPSQHYA